MNELAIKMAIETTTSCQLVSNFLVCAVERSRLHKLKSFGVIGRHSKLYCLCSRDIQNFVCAIATFKTLLFVQSRHSKLYCLCSRSIRNFLVCVSLLGLLTKACSVETSNISGTQQCSISTQTMQQQENREIDRL